MRQLAAAFILMVSPAAFAQEKPSFDCAKAASAVERTICKSAELAKVDREVAKAYADLSAKLAGSARDHLASDQARWLANRNRGCAVDVDEMEDCLRVRYGVRAAELEFLAKDDYPFISEQAIIKTGKVKRVDYSIDAAYPQFDAKSADFTTVNRRFAEAAQQAGNRAIPAANKIEDDLEQGWSYEQNFVLYRPTRQAVAVAINYRTYTGGAHGYTATNCSLVDLRNGRLLGTDDVFVAGDEWLTRLIELVRDDLKEQFADRPGNDFALEPEYLAKLLRQSQRYLFRDDNVLEVIFNPYEVGPYAAGPYSVEISYDDLRPVIRADGPLGN
jgi:uncharacterized protein